MVRTSPARDDADHGARAGTISSRITGPGTRAGSAAAVRTVIGSPRAVGGGPGVLGVEDGPLVFGFGVWQVAPSAAVPRRAPGEDLDGPTPNSGAGSSGWAVLAIATITGRWHQQVDVRARPRRTRSSRARRRRSTRTPWKKDSVGARSRRLEAVLGGGQREQLTPAGDPMQAPPHRTWRCCRPASWCRTGRRGGPRCRRRRWPAPGPGREQRVAAPR